MVQYILTQKIGISIEELAVVDNFSGVIYYFLFLALIDKVKHTPLWKLFVYGNLARLSSVLLFSIFLNWPVQVQIGSRFVYYIFSRFTTDFFVVPLVVRISKHLPEGFESTGVVVILSLSYTASTYSGILARKQQTIYHIKNGYYERGFEMFVTNLFIAVGLAVIAPLFLAWG